MEGIKRKGGGGENGHATQLGNFIIVFSPHKTRLGLLTTECYPVAFEHIGERAQLVGQVQFMLLVIQKGRGWMERECTGCICVREEKGCGWINSDVQRL